jgi:uncharacterized protein YbjT (DUF2867 family)
MSSKILVTGASGNIGSELVRALRGRGAEFEILRSRREDKAADVPARYASFEDVAALQRAFSGVETLFVLLPFAPNKMALANNVAAAARLAGVGRIVRSSGAGADPRSSIALSRVQGEIDDLLAATGIPSTFLRPSGFMQNLTGYQAAQIRAGALYAPTGEGKHSVIDVRDIADAAAAVLLNPAPHAGKAYTLTGPAAYSNAEIAALISAATGKPLKFVDIPEAAARDSMRQSGTPDKIIEWLLSLSLAIKTGLASMVTTHVRDLTGHAPRTLEAFVAQNAGAWR